MPTLRALFLAALVLLAGTYLLLPRVAAACQCAGVTLAERASASDLVFLGQIASVSHDRTIFLNPAVPSHRGVDYSTEYWTVEVQHSFKGAPPMTVVVRNEHLNSCRLDPAPVGAGIMIFSGAQAATDTLHADMCSGMKTGQYAELRAKIVAALGPPIWDYHDYWYHEILEIKACQDSTGPVQLNGAIQPSG